MSHEPGIEKQAGNDAPAGLQAFHVAFAVHDIVIAAPRFARVLGVSFREPVERETLVETADDRTPTKRRVLMSYSLEGPPYFELVQVGEDVAEGIHHVGVWVPDVAGQRTRNDSAGLGDELVIRHEGREDIRCWTSDPASLHGVRLEFFDQGWQPTFDDWLTSGWPSEGDQPNVTPRPDH